MKNIIKQGKLPITPQILAMIKRAEERQAKEAQGLK